MNANTKENVQIAVSTICLVIIANDARKKMMSKRADRKFLKANAVQS